MTAAPQMDAEKNAPPLEKLKKEDLRKNIPAYNHAALTDAQEVWGGYDDRAEAEKVQLSTTPTR